MPAITFPQDRTIHRAIPFTLYFIGGLLIFLFGSNTFGLFPTNRSAGYEWGLTLALFILVEFLRRSVRFNSLWRLAFALFVASFANALNLFLGNWLARLLPAPGSLMETIAVDKLSQAIPVVAAIVLFTWLSRASFGSIYLRKGNLKQGLLFGAISFAIFSLIFALIAVWQSAGPNTQGITASGIRLDTIVSAIPWILVFVLANGFMEELWFRGLSLGRLIPHLGPGLSILVTALVFGMLHLGATYVSPIEMFIFSVITFLLGLVNGTVMHKTNAIWGSFLFHAGYDLMVIIPILASLYQ